MMADIEQGIIAAIENIIDNPTDNNKKALKNLFSKGFDSNKATLFEMIQIGEDGTSVLSAEQQKVLFDSLETKQNS